MASRAEEHTSRDAVRSYIVAVSSAYKPANPHSSVRAWTLSSRQTARRQKVGGEKRNDHQTLLAISHSTWVARASFQAARVRLYACIKGLLREVNIISTAAWVRVLH